MLSVQEGLNGINDCSNFIIVCELKSEILVAHKLKDAKYFFLKSLNFSHFEFNFFQS